MTSRMLEEALEAPHALARQLAADAGTYAALGAALRAAPPAGALTVARGSSDHAAHYFGYLVMARLGQLVTSLPMSLVTLYPATLQGAGLLSVAFSQSGRSPDLVAPTRHLRAGGARTVAVVNDASSPLAGAAEWVLPLRAGTEASVAATKSYLAQLCAGARIAAAWGDDPVLAAALAALPAALERAAALSWAPMVDRLANAERLYVVGRGLGLAVAQEAALKLKEVCGIQAEAFSAAELRHGPMVLVGRDYPLLVFAPRGPAQDGLLALADEMRGRGAQVLVAGPGGDLPLAEAAHEDLDPIALIQSFYPAAEALARARGRDPDQPPFLAKVTCTH